MAFSKRAVRRLTVPTFGLLALALSTEGVFARDEIVTTRKREERVQDVPIAITAITEEELTTLGITNAQDIAKFSSSVIFDQGFAQQDTRITIRGLTPSRGRQNVAVLVDGIDISSQAILTNGGSLLINPELLDIERVEIVKGPQNALYGRSAFAGAINYITKQPTDTFRSTVNADIGNNGQYSIRGNVSGPLAGDSLFGAINVAGWNHDGFYDNAVTGDGVGGKDGGSVSGSLRWEPADTIRITGRLDYLDDNYELSPYVAIEPTTLLPTPESARVPTTDVPPIGPVISPTVTEILAVVGDLPDSDLIGQPGALGQATIAANPVTGDNYDGVEREVIRGTLTAEFDLGSTLLTSLSHLATSDIKNIEDATRYGDRQPFVGGLLWTDDEVDLISQELRLQSQSEGALNWTVGALYWNEDQSLTDRSFNCIQSPQPFPPAPGLPCSGTIASYLDGTNPVFPESWEREVEHWSVYGLVEYDISEAFAVIAEARYTDEETTVSGPADGSRLVDARGPGPGFTQFITPSTMQSSGTVDDDFFSPKITLQWTPSDTQTYYVSWADATKPAGISPLTGGGSGFDAQANEFDPEEMQVYEIGGKTAWLDNSLIANFAIFYQDYTDKQVSSQLIDPATGLLAPRPLNASAAEVTGAEIDLLWTPIEQLDLSLSYTWLDTEYDEYEQLSAGVAPIAAAGNCTPFLPPGGASGDEVCRLNLSGRELEGAPENSAILGANWRAPLGDDMEWNVGGDVIYQDERFTDEFNLLTYDSYTEVNLRAGISTDNWSLLAYVDNVFEDDAIKSGFRNIYAPGLGFSFGPPITLILPNNFVALLPDKRQVGVRFSMEFGE